MSQLRMSPKAILKRARRFLETWEGMRPEKEFAGLSLEQFREQMRPAVEARYGLAQIARNRQSLLLRRNFADRALLQTMKRITSAVVGDVQEGDDGEFYGALGFVRRSQRKVANLTRRPKKRTRRVRVRAPSSVRTEEAGNDCGS